MPKVKCESQTKHSPQDAYAKLKSLLETDRELRAMDSSYKCTFDDAALSGTAKGSKFEADLRVSPAGGGAGHGSTVAIEVSLPLMLTPLKGVVQSTLQKKMDAALA